MRLRHALIYSLSAGAACAGFLALNLNQKFSSGVYLVGKGASGAENGQGWGLSVLIVLGALCVTNLAAILLLAAAFREERSRALLQANLIQKESSEKAKDEEKAEEQAEEAKSNSKAGGEAEAEAEAEEGSALGLPGGAERQAQVLKFDWGEVAPWSAAHGQGFCDLWNSSCQNLYGAFPKAWEKFEKFFSSPEFDTEASAVALSSQGQLLGAILALRQPAFEDDGYWWLESPAVVAALLVDPSKRNLGIGRALLKTAESVAIRRKRPRLFVGGLENFPHLVPGVPDGDHAARMFYLATGFVEVRRTCHMEAELQGFQVPLDLVEREKSLAEKGYTFAPARLEDLEDYRAFIEKSNLDRKQRRLEKFEADWSRIFFTLKDGQIAGFLQVTAKDDLGHSGIRLIYFLREHRGVGLGSVLLNKAHILWQRLAVSKASIWTYPEAAKRFYPRAGFKTVQEWVCYEKDLHHNWQEEGFVNRWR